ncbi:MAG: LysR family transcriptional regulator [Clostridia bacterium]|nr:LysR family transcriptional regulator [Clostridia bacterium]
MEFREMQYIITIEKYMNISRAADALYISQPTLSKCLQKVENEIGQPLFKRVGKRLMITYAGEVFINKARNILEMEKAMNQELSEIMENGRGVLNVAFPVMRASYMLPEILPAFRERYPNVRLKLMEGHSYLLDEALLKGSVDIAFYNLSKENPNLKYDVITTEELILVAAPDAAIKSKAVKLPECHYPYVSIREIANEPFILTNKMQRTRQLIDSVLLRDDVELTNTIEITNIMAGIQLAAKGYGYTLTSESHIRHLDLPENTNFFSITVPSITSDFVAATRRNTYRSEFMQAFIDIVREKY